MDDDNRPHFMNPRHIGLGEYIGIVTGVIVAVISIHQHDVFGWKLAGACVVSGVVIDILFFRRGSNGGKKAAILFLVIAGIWAYSNPSSATHDLMGVGSWLNSYLGGH